MVPRPLARARTTISRTCTDVIQPCQVDYEPRSARGARLKIKKKLTKARL